MAIERILAEMGNIQDVMFNFKRYARKQMLRRVAF